MGACTTGSPATTGVTTTPRMLRPSARLSAEPVPSSGVARSRPARPPECRTRPVDVRRRYLAQRRRTLIFWLKVAAGVVAGLLLLAIAYLLWRPRLDIRAEPPSPSAAPSASASASPPPFDQALPTQPSDGQKPKPPPR
jgi:hypothetical protein